MTFNHARLNRRSFAALGAGAAAGLMAASKPAFAQDATPAASPVAEAAGVFDATGLTEIVITAEQYTFGASVPGAMGEGWYIITLDNQSDTVTNVNLGQLPSGPSGGALSAAVSSFASDAPEIPEWWADATFAGGAVAAPGESVSTLAYLTPGAWYMFRTYAGAQQSPSSFRILTAEELEANYGIAADAAATPEASPVTGPVAPEGVVAGVTVELGSDMIGASGVPAAGPQVLQVTNAGDTPSDLIVLHTTETYDPAGAVSLATAWMRGEETDAMVVAGVGALSAGKVAFIEADVHPGNYVIFSSLPAADGSLQVENGVVTVFTAQ
jgi:hypothetical protein